MLSQELKRKVLKFKIDFNLHEDVRAIEKLEAIIDSTLKITDNENDELEEVAMVWSGYFGRSLVVKFEGKWIEGNKVQIFDGEIIDPVVAIQNYILGKKNSSLINLYADIHRRYFNAHNNIDEQKGLILEEQRKEVVSRFLDSMGLGGFVPIHSPEDFLKIEENKHRVRLLMAHFEEIYPELKQLKEYQELRQLPLSSEEARQKIEEIKNIVAEKGDPQEMTLFGIACYEGSKIEQNDEEAWFWTKKAAEKGRVPAMHNLGILYLNGIGCIKDSVKGKYWLKKGADLGDEKAKEQLKKLEEDREE